MADEEIKLLHFIQEQARRDAEIAMARRKCIELEENIRDYHDRLVCGLGCSACECGWFSQQGRKINRTINSIKRRN